MITNASCTIFKSNGTGFDRFFVPSCHWQENKANNVLKSGLQNADSVTVYIPVDSMVIAPGEMLLPSGNLYPGSSCMPESPAKDIVVKGKCNFVFENETPQSISQSMKEFTKKYKFHTIMSVDCKLYGSRDMQHIKISAR